MGRNLSWRVGNPGELTIGGKMRNYKRNKKTQIVAIVIVAFIILAMVLTLIPTFML
jgi:hypothetical protein